MRWCTTARVAAPAQQAELQQRSARPPKGADDDKRRAEQERRDVESKAWTARRDAWIAQNIAPDALDYPRRYGYRSPFAVVLAYEAATKDVIR